MTDEQIGTPEPDAEHARPPIPDVLPVLPLRGTVLLPLAVIPVAVSNPSSIKLVDDTMRGNRMVMIAAQKGGGDTPGPDDIHKIGTVAVIHQLFRVADGSLRLVVQGIERARILDLTSTDPYFVARIETLPDRVESTDAVQALHRAALDLFRKIVQLAEELPDELLSAAEQLDDPRQVAYFVATVT